VAGARLCEPQQRSKTGVDGNFEDEDENEDEDEDEDECLSTGLKRTPSG
jgi:hypothetical protein